MKFATIISGAGLDPKKYPRLSEVPIEVFDRKSRMISVSTFASPLFSKRPDSLKRFESFLEENEKERFTSMQVNLHEGFISLFPNGCKACIFMRV